MARRKRVPRRRGGRVDAGASWISYSDMMAALLLVFVLVLCNSMYQYFSMMEIKSAELDEQKTQMEEQQSQLEIQQIILLAKEAELTGALTLVDEKEAQLAEQNLTLEEQQKVIIAAQAALQQKELALAAAQVELTEHQEKLDASALLLQNQQRKLDDLVGVRTKIIQELGTAFSAANLKVSVDKNTGDIMLESAVFFDTGKDDIKPGGMALLDEFIPVYLSVLLQKGYVDFLGEIVIEGHTDTTGTYLRNLQLSQERALSVATYCLEMPGLSEAQREELRQILTAKGRSFSSPVLYEDGSVDMDASRRVEFKFRLKDAEMIDELRNILAP